MPPAPPEPGEVEEDEAGGHSDFITCKRENDAQLVLLFKTKSSQTHKQCESMCIVVTLDPLV